MQYTTRRVEQFVQSIRYRSFSSSWYALFATLFFPVLLTPSFAFAATPVPNAINDLATSQYSHNWSGYAVNTSNVSNVSGSWVVPTATATSQDMSADATWIGIGGLGTHDLIQTGTQTLFRNGMQSVTAWYELLPDTSHAISLMVSPGDHMQASIALVPNTTNKWLITLTDVTTGKSFSNMVTYNSSQNSAEWIQEMPSTSKGYVALDQFGTAQFTNSSVTANGMVQSLSQSGAHSITMIKQDRTPLTQVSGLTNGTDFSVTRTNALAETTRPASAASATGSATTPVPVPSYVATSTQQQIATTFKQVLRSYTYTKISRINGKVVVQVVTVN